MIRAFVLLFVLAMFVGGATCAKKETSPSQPAKGTTQSQQPRVVVAPEDDIFLDLDVEPDYEGEPPFKVQFVLEVEDAVGPVKYEWDFGDGSPKNHDPQPTHVYKKAGDYTAVVTVTDSRGVSASDDIDIYVEKEE